MARQTTPEQIELAERVRKGLLLRRQGASYEQIATECGWNSAQAAHKAISKAIRAIPQDEAAENRAITNERIDRILFAILPRANLGHTDAIDRFIALEVLRGRRCGYDATTGTGKGKGDGAGAVSKATATVRIYLPSNGREQAETGGGEQSDGGGA